MPKYSVVRIEAVIFEEMVCVEAESAKDACLIAETDDDLMEQRKWKEVRTQTTSGPRFGAKVIADGETFEDHLRDAKAMRRITD